MAGALGRVRAQKTIPVDGVEFPTTVLFNHQPRRYLGLYLSGKAQRRNYFEAFYAPVGLCLETILLSNGHPLYNGWYCPICHIDVKSWPSDHLYSNNHMGNLLQAWGNVTPTLQQLRARKGVFEMLLSPRNPDLAVCADLFTGELTVVPASMAPNARTLPEGQPAFTDFSRRGQQQSRNSGFYEWTTLLQSRVVQERQPNRSLPDIAALEAYTIAVGLLEAGPPPRDISPNPIFNSGTTGVAESAVDLRKSERLEGWPIAMPMGMPPWKGRDGIPVINGQTSKHLARVDGVSVVRGQHEVKRCHIIGSPDFSRHPQPSTADTQMGYNQYHIGMASSCTPTAIAWAALCAQGADPGCNTTMEAAFGYAIGHQVIGEASVLEDAVNYLGLFKGATCQAVHFHADLARFVFGELWSHAHQKGPAVVITTAAGKTTAAFMTSGEAWHFDSHARLGATVTFHNEVPELCELVTQNARAAGKQVTCTVIWKGTRA